MSLYSVDTAIGEDLDRLVESFGIYPRYSGESDPSLRARLRASIGFQAWTKDSRTAHRRAFEEATAKLNQQLDDLTNQAVNPDLSLASDADLRKHVAATLEQS